MKALIIKITSLGDIIHTLPALTEASFMMALKHSAKLQDKEPVNISFDWVVEEHFAEIVQWHENVNDVIPIATRRWRQNMLTNGYQIIKDVLASLKKLRLQKYDVIIDPQGLFKSAIVSRLAKGQRYIGFNKSSIKEPLAAKLYNEKYSVNNDAHAVLRTKELFAKAFHYESDQHNFDYGIVDFFEKNKSNIPPLANDNKPNQTKPYVVFLHATTWSTKHWPLAYWQSLGKMLNKQDYTIYLPWGNEDEKTNATIISEALEDALVLDKLSLTQMAQIIYSAQGVVAVDTGLGHLSAALAKPCVSIYGATDALKTGALGYHQAHVSVEFECSPCLKKTCRFEEDALVSKQGFPPCYQTVSANIIFNRLKSLLTLHSTKGNIHE